jgi:hypothetical protein
MKHVLYGMRGADVAQAALLIAQALECDFQERESDYLGIYQIARIAEAHIRVMSQTDPEGDPIEEEFEEYETLIYVDGESAFPQIESLTAPQGPLEKLRDHV